ncbi:RluA family pseudouridine synthase [Hominimerdicola sp. 21CYCFAH17_S]
MSVKIIIASCEDGRTLGEALSKRGISRRLITSLKRTENGITRDGKTIRTIDRIKAGDEIILNERDLKTLEPNSALNVPVLYEDCDLVVFDKPPLMPVHPSVKHQGDTLGNFFAARYPGIAFRPVNRLDRDTSGCVICAKSRYGAAKLQKSFEKTYYAVCCGFPPKEGRIDAPIARERESIIKRQVSPDGQRAVTNYRIIVRSDKYSLAEIRLETGRTHQIRVHFAYIGCPLAGDDMYGGSMEDYTRQALHCASVSFEHPISGEKITVSSKLPDNFSL